MAISYNGLWKQLIDHGMKKGDLCAKTGLSSSTIAKMTNCESVKLSVLEKICKELDCNFGDLIDYVPDPTYTGNIFPHDHRRWKCAGKSTYVCHFKENAGL